MEKHRINYRIVKNTPKTLRDLESFCKLLRAKKVKDAQNIFSKLPLTVQCLLLHNAWEIMVNKPEHSNDSYITASRLFQLFQDEEKTKVTYNKYTKLQTLEKYYNKALEWNRKKDKSPAEKLSSKSLVTKTIAELPKKEYQKYEAPASKIDPLYIYYTSLYTQNPESRLAITWLVENGVYDDEQREEIVAKYEKLAKKGEIVKYKK